MSTTDTLVEIGEARPEAEGSPVPDPAEAPARRRGGLVATVAVTTSLLGLVALLFLAFEFGATGLFASRAQRTLLRDFKEEVAAGTATVPNFVPSPGEAIGIVSIPRLSREVVVVEGTEPDDTKVGVGHLRSSPLPGQVGNVVLAGHRTTYGGPFADLGELQAGDPVVVTTGQGVFTYLVRDVGIVAPGQTDVTGSTRASRLTLMTSSPKYSPTGRLYVIADLQGSPFAAAAREPVTLDGSESGLAGDPDALGSTILWIELLGAALLIVWELRGRGVPPRVLYLLATPVLLALLELVFENGDRLLPGTL